MPDREPTPSESRAKQTDHAISSLIAAAAAEGMGEERKADMHLTAATVHSSLALSHALDQLEGTVKAVARAWWQQLPRRQERAS